MDAASGIAEQLALLGSWTATPDALTLTAEE